MPKAKAAPTATAIDLSYLKAARLLLAEHHTVRITLVGCGGTGSWLAPSIVRLARSLKDAGRGVEVVFVDPDKVEPKNTLRQNFCDAEVGLPKAHALASRYGLAWGLGITAVKDRFDPSSVSHVWNTLVIMVGCVDNADGRAQLTRALSHNRRGSAPHIFHLDCGNTAEAGQVYLGTAAEAADLKGAFISPGFCQTLPAPALQQPALLVPRPEEKTDNNLSCAEIQQANFQSLCVNQKVAAEAADYLLRLATGGELRRFATYFDLASGSSRSRYTTPEEVASVIDRPLSYVIDYER